MHLRSLAIEDATRLIQQRSNKGDREAARALAEQLGGMPLAVEAVGYMEATGMPLAYYLAAFRTRAASSLARTLIPRRRLLRLPGNSRYALFRRTRRVIGLLSFCGHCRRCRRVRGLGCQSGVGSVAST